MENIYSDIDIYFSNVTVDLESLFNNFVVFPQLVQTLVIVVRQTQVVHTTTLCVQTIHVAVRKVPGHMK